MQVGEIATSHTFERRSRAERSASGKSVRSRVPRSLHAEVHADGRPDPIELLEQQAKTRVPELMPVRYGRMAASPYAFLRGAALIMASDLSRAPSTGIWAQLCGDAHMQNFRLFGTPERNLIFDASDFDETLPGPWEWDLKRLLTSIELAGREDGFTSAQRLTCLLEAARAYRVAMREFAEQRNLEVWYAHLSVQAMLADYQRLLDRRLLRKKEKAIRKAQRRDSMDAFSKLTFVENGVPHFVSRPPLLVPFHELADAITPEPLDCPFTGIIRGYRGTLDSNRRVLFEQFRFLELARRVVGVGSVGTRCWIALFLGADENDPLILQIKEAEDSALERFLRLSAYANHGERVVRGQRLIQAHGDILLGWTSAKGGDGVVRDYYVRQLRDWKGSFLVEEMTPAAMSLFSQACAWTLARAHARTGDRVVIAAYLGRSDVFDRAVVRYARAYADQTERDHEMLTHAIRAGRISAERGI
jgi:uncharacterized protein (DUF2252 family)